MSEGSFEKDPSKMSDTEYSAWITETMMGGWVPLRQYLRTYPDETQAKIDTRLSRKVWERGVHFAVPPKSRAWVNLPAIRQWIESGVGDGLEPEGLVTGD
jgi:hypothetical protein